VAADEVLYIKITTESISLNQEKPAFKKTKKELSCQVSGRKNYKKGGHTWYLGKGCTVQYCICLE
jgi:hypothetical protein